MTAQREQGHILALTGVTDGDELMSAAILGSTFLVVEDAADFGEEGGWLRIVSDTASEILPYDTYDEIPDSEWDSITLTASLTATYPVGSRVDVWNLEDDGPVTEYVAQVSVDGQDPNRFIEANIDHKLADKLAQGIRTGAGESVEIEFPDFGPPAVVKVFGKVPEIDGAFVKNPFMTARKAATTPTASNTWTPVTDWELLHMTDDLSFNSSTGEFTISKPGIYSFTFGATYVANTVGVRGVRPVYVLNGVTQAGRVVEVPADPANEGSAETSQIVQLDAGDSVRFDTIQNSGGSLNLMQFTYRTSVSLVRIAPS